MNHLQSLKYSVDKTLKQLTILYIEDEDNIRLNIEKTLQLLCKEVYSASDANIALELFQKNKIDIILSDISLPGMSGLEFTRIIRKEDTLIPVILLTAHTNKNFLLEATRLKLIDYLTKPIDFEMLHIALKQATQEILQNGTYSVNFMNDTSYNIHKKLLTQELSQKEISLTSKEIVLLEYFLKYKDTIISTDELKSVLWEDSDYATDSALKNLLNKLRTKIGKTSISNISGVGYRIILK